MSQELTFHPFDGEPRKFTSRDIIPGAWHYLLGWLSGGEESEADRYHLIEMYQGDDDYFEVVTFDGEPIGVIDRADIGKADLDRFETHEQRELREGAEDAARDDYYEMQRELRRAAE